MSTKETPHPVDELRPPELDAATRSLCRSTKTQAANPCRPHARTPPPITTPGTYWYPEFQRALWPIDKLSRRHLFSYKKNLSRNVHSTSEADNVYYTLLTSGSGLSMAIRAPAILCRSPSLWPYSNLRFYIPERERFCPLKMIYPNHAQCIKSSD